LYEEKGDKAVFVVPVFEILKGHQCPDDKADLKDAQMTRKEVRPFHNATCRWCHEPEDHDNWLMKPKNEHMEVAFNATWNKIGFDCLYLLGLIMHRLLINMSK